MKRRLLYKDQEEAVSGGVSFRTTWDTTKSGISLSDEIALPLLSTGTYNFDVTYGGSIIHSCTSYLDNVITFPDGAGIKEIEITGTIQGFKFNNAGDRAKLLRIDDAEGLTPLSGGDGALAFRGCVNLEYADVSNTDTSLLTDCFGWFWSCSNLTYLDATNLSTALNTRIGAFIRSCGSITEIIGTNTWDTSNCTKFVYFAQGATNLTTLDVSTWNTGSCDNFGRFIQNCSNLITLDVSNWDVSNGIDFLEFAQNATSLTTLDVSTWDVSNAAKLTSFAINCPSLTVLDIRNWDVRKMTEMISFHYNGTDTAISTQIYSQALQYWDTLPMAFTNRTVQINAQYDAAGATAKANIIAQYNWSFNDNGLNQILQP